MSDEKTEENILLIYFLPEDLKYSLIQISKPEIINKNSFYLVTKNSSLHPAPQISLLPIQLQTQGLRTADWVIHGD